MPARPAPTIRMSWMASSVPFMRAP
jgi:hypothetical protein